MLSSTISTTQEAQHSAQCSRLHAYRPPVIDLCGKYAGGYVCVMVCVNDVVSLFNEYFIRKSRLAVPE